MQRTYYTSLFIIYYLTISNKILNLYKLKVVAEPVEIVVF